MKQSKSAEGSLNVGDRVKLKENNPSWKAEEMLRGKIGEVTEIRIDGRVSVRFDGGRLLMGRPAETYEEVQGKNPKAGK